jgi:hypothetical protein
VISSSTGATREPELGLVLVPARRVRDQQLDGRVAGRRVDGEQAQQRTVVRGRLLTAGAQRREALAELGRERRVQDVQQLLARAEVHVQAAHDALGAAPEDAHVRVPEAVDRLELVADREQVVPFQVLEDLQLHRVRVLELVDHDQAEPLSPALARLGVLEQVASAQLEILEVDRRALLLGLLERAPVAVQQRVYQRERGVRVVLRAGRAIRGPGLAVGLADV